MVVAIAAGTAFVVAAVDPELEDLAHNALVTEAHAVRRVESLDGVDRVMSELVTMRAVIPHLVGGILDKGETPRIPLVDRGTVDPDSP